VLTANKGKGFTLVDHIILILILGVLGMIAIPQFQSMVAESKLNEAAGEPV
jgi:Tfp pilus assembly protein PilE